jgi:hypothetical protein
MTSSGRKYKSGMYIKPSGCTRNAVGTDLIVDVLVPAAPHPISCPIEISVMARTDAFDLPYVRCANKHTPRKD